VEICLALEMPVETAFRNLKVTDKVVKAQTCQPFAREYLQRIRKPLFSGESSGFY
jgi:hypothetical protein